MKKSMREMHHVWPKDAAGHRMTTKVPTTLPGKTLKEVHEEIARNISSLKTINYIYVLDEGRRLIGVLSLRDLYRLPGNANIGDVCKRKPLVEMKASSHQERAAYLALQHNIKAIPVVDHNHVFLGAIPSDAILTILHKEMHEDILRLVGIHHPKALTGNILELPIIESFKHRIPWLFLGLLGGLLSASIIGAFERTLQHNLLLAAFLPLIVYMSDAVRTQMEAYIIRDLAYTPILPIWKYFGRQFFVVLLIALSFGLLLLLASSLLHQSTVLGVTLGLALGIAILSSVCTGLLVPYALSRIRMDPADASGPLATILQDILSVTIYFVVASQLL